MAHDFSKSVDDGLKLSKRLYLGKDRNVTAPTPISPMKKLSSSSSPSYIPTSPMLYAVISDPSIVDNPDMPSYQPHVHGTCDPPAFIPLHMNSIEMNFDTYLDTAFVRICGSWRLHCVMASRSSDCLLAVPMGEQGSILGVEVEVSKKSYSSELIAIDDKADLDKEAKPENGGLLLPHIFTVTFPKIDGGSNISIKLSWSQKLLYRDGEFSVIVPFRFPDYVTPSVKKLPKKEKIEVNINSCTGTEILCKTTSHPLKELRREVGKLAFLYESEVQTWTKTDFSIAYAVSSSHLFGGVLLQSPSVHDVDQREMFFIYIFPGDQRGKKVFRKEIVFVIDISGSMEGKPLEASKNALSASLIKLDPKDSFNIIAFNGETYLFSSTMESATKENAEKAVQWMDTNFIAGGSTNISLPLDQAMKMLSDARSSYPLIFLVTDGSVEDERQICDVIKSQSTGGGSIRPRIYTFGIGSYCNHHFLRMLAIISRGQHAAALDVDSVEDQMLKLFNRASSAVLANISVDTFSDLDDLEVFPSRIPDLSSQGPLCISGRYNGSFPDNIKATGVSGDASDFVIDLKIQKSKDIPFDKVFAKQQIDVLTAQAWFSEDKQLEEKVAKISIQTGVVSEYTRLSILESERASQAAESSSRREILHKINVKKVDTPPSKRIVLRNLCPGFGDLTATAENIPPGAEGSKLPEAAEMFVNAASNCCGKLCSHICCMCCIQCCSRINNQCAIALTQLSAALACFGCLECCSLCCPGDE